MQKRNIYFAYHYLYPIMRSLCVVLRDLSEHGKIAVIDRIETLSHVIVFGGTCLQGSPPRNRYLERSVVTGTTPFPPNNKGLSSNDLLPIHYKYKAMRLNCGCWRSRSCIYYGHYRNRKRTGILLVWFQCNSSACGGGRVLHCTG